MIDFKIAGFSPKVLLVDHKPLGGNFLTWGLIPTESFGQQTHPICCTEKCFKASLKTILQHWRPEHKVLKYQFSILSLQLTVDKSMSCWSDFFSHRRASICRDSGSHVGWTPPSPSLTDSSRREPGGTLRPRVIARPLITAGHSPCARQIPRSLPKYSQSEEFFVRLRLASTSPTHV